MSLCVYLLPTHQTHAPLAFSSFPPTHPWDARVYGQTTTAKHEIEYISPIEYTPPFLHF